MAENVKFVPGTYTVTANLYVPGEKNIQLPGVNAFMTNPDNPLGIVDENGSCEKAVPNTPVIANASLTVGEDGVTKTLTIPVKNPVFTLQSIASGSDVTLVDLVRNSTVYSFGNGLISRNGRITSLTVSLKDNSGDYEFTNCVEFPTLLGTEWTVPLSLAVDLASLPVWKEPETEAPSEPSTEPSTENPPETEPSTEPVSETEPSTEKTSETETETETETENKTEKKLAPGTYRVTANVYLPGEKNTELPGTTAYMTNPANPLGIGGHTGIPMEPVKDNATLVVDKKGTLTVIVDLVNPVFTLQKVEAGRKVTLLAVERDQEIYAGVSGQASRKGRITRLYVSLKDCSGIYSFKNCVEFPTLLETDWKVPLELSVDFSSAKRISKSTKVTIPKTDEEEPKETEAPVTEPETETKEPETEETEKPTEAAGESGRLQPGVYTVAANIWIDRASSGLPLSPHLTSSVFPPKDPVSNNAQVTIDENGNAVVSVPIVIPSKVMSVKSISGLEIIGSTANGGYLTGITVNLGLVTDPNAVITKSCSVSLDLGELAQTIAHKGEAQVWNATFQVSFSGIPSAASGGGNVDVSELLSEASSEKETEESKEEQPLRLGLLKEKEAIALVSLFQEQEEKNVTFFWSEEETAASEEEKKETEEKLWDAFEEGICDLILTEPEVVQEALKEEDRDFFMVGLLTYEPEDENEKAENRVLLAKQTFAKEKEKLLAFFLKEAEKSVKIAKENPQETAVFAFSKGLAESARKAQSFLTENPPEFFTGEVLKEKAEELDQAFSEGTLFWEPEENLFDQPETGETKAEEKENEKIEITDAASLSSALDAALEKKKDGETEETEIEGSNSMGLDTEEQKAAAAGLTPGTYQVSANLYLPGERNTELPGTTAYMTNPDNPLGIGGHTGIPMAPVSDNGTLVVGADGSKTLILEVVNPVFTLQKIDGAVNSEILAAVRDEERYEGTNGVGVDGRITKLFIRLKDDSGLYPFDDCQEFPTLLETDWQVDLELGVEFTAALRISEETEVGLPKS